MATFYSNRTEVATAAQVIPARVNLGVVSEIATFTVVAGLATADVIQMVKVRTGFKLLELCLTANASVAATASLSLGDGGDVDRFILATSYAGAGTLTRLNAPVTGPGYTYTADDTIDITCASIATPVAGTIITLVVLGHYL